MVRLAFILFSVTFCMHALGQSSVLIPENSSVKFQIKNAGLGVNGTFADPTISIQFDPENLSASKIQGAVEVSTIKTGIEMRDAHLQGREYFDSEKFPLITFDSKSFQSTSKNKYVGKFDVAMHGITRQVEMPFTYSRRRGGEYFKGEVDINRLDFKLGEESIILSNDVHVMIEVLIRTPIADGMK